MASRDTLESFREKSVARYGEERFDLSEVDYQGSKKKIAIRCKRHDYIFLTRPGSFLRASIESGGCSKCQGEVHGQKMHILYGDSKEDFVEKSKSIYGERFDYSLVQYINNHSKVRIRCRRHDLVFDVTPSNHKCGPGCPDCKKDAIKKSLTMTQHDFEELCNLAHGNEYIYGEYKGMHKSVQIKCLVHGWFVQIANDHRHGSKCQQCALESRKEKLRLSLDDYCSRADLIHNFKYQYTKMVYTTTRSNIAVICPSHGEFLINAGNHLMGQGCQACSKEIQSREAMLTAEEFVRRAKNIHGDKYDYGESEYLGAREVLIIRCRIHGEFRQIPNYHLSGNGCQKCANENKGKDGVAQFMRNSEWGSQECYLYIAGVGEYAKIGIARDFHQRKKNSGNRYRLVKMWKLVRVKAWLVEQVLLRKTLDLRPDFLPEEFLFWHGKTELRACQGEKLENLIEDADCEVSRIDDKDWLNYAVENKVGFMGCGWGEN